MVPFPVGLYTPAAANKRFWRVTMPAEVNGSGGLSIVTLQFRIAGVDQAGSGTASARSDFGGGFTADLAFDGDTGTRWASDFSNTWPQWIQYDFGLGVSKEITSVKLVPNSDATGPTEALIQYSAASGVGLVTARNVTGLTISDWTGVGQVGGSGAGITWTIP